jgi:hypothetical protein
VQVLAFTTSVEFETPLLSSISALEESLSQLESLVPASAGTDHAEVLGHAMATAMRAVRPADMVCMISDMFFPAPRDVFLADLEDLGDACDVIALVMRDRVDMRMPPLRGGLRVRDMESGRVFLAGGVSRTDPVDELDSRGIEACVLLTSQSDARWHESLSDFFAGRLERR